MCANFVFGCIACVRRVSKATIQESWRLKNKREAENGETSGDDSTLEHESPDVGTPPKGKFVHILSRT